MARKTRKRTYLVTSGRMVLRLTEAKEGGFVVTMLRQARVKLLVRLKSKARAS